MRINTREFWKILGRVWIAPKRIFETFCTQEALRCSGMNATLTTFYLIQKIKQGFYYTIFPVKEKINVGKIFKIMRKFLFK
jgi:flavin-dependent dehydrogenase